MKKLLLVLACLVLVSVAWSQAAVVRSANVTSGSDGWADSGWTDASGPARSEHNTYRFVFIGFTLLATAALTGSFAYRRRVDYL